MIVVCHNKRLASAHGAIIVQLLRSPWFQTVFGDLLMAARDEECHLKTYAGGEVFLASISERITGLTAHVAIVDDLVDIEDAHNEAKHERAFSFFRNTLYSRLDNQVRSAIGIVGHRLTSEDYLSKIERSEDWVVLRFPFVATRDTNVFYNDCVWIRRAGELLRPAGFTESYLRGCRANPLWPFLMQQACDDDIPAQICRGDFSFYDDLPSRMPVVVSVDPGHCSQPGGSYSAIVAWGILQDGYYFIDAARGHFDSNRLCNEIAKIAKRWNVGTILVEETGFGREAIPRLKNCFNVVAITQPSQSKVERALKHVDLFQRKNVYVRRSSAHADTLIEELVTIGHGLSSDLADATTQFFAWHRQDPRPEVVAPKPRALGVVLSSRQARALPPGAHSGPGVVLFARDHSQGLGEPRTRDEKLTASLLRGGSRGRI
jgi:phage terminase large subunit-like protein